MDTFTLATGSSHFRTVDQITGADGIKWQSGGVYDKYLAANGAYAVWVVTHHPKNDANWVYEEGIYQTAVDYIALKDGLPSPSSPIQEKWDDTSTSNYLDPKAIKFQSAMPDQEIDPAEFGVGALKAVGGVVRIGASTRDGLDDGALEGYTNLVDGLSDMYTASLTNPDKYVTGPSWNVTVGANGSISGGGMAGTQPIHGSNDPYGYPGSW